MKRLALVALVLAPAACNWFNPNARFGTALYVTVTFDAPAIDQLQISVPLADMTTMLAPDPAAGALTSPQTVRLLLSDSLDGQTATVHVNGLSAGVPVSTGDGMAVVVKSIEVDVAVALTAIAAADCNATTCKGCCSGKTCVAGNDAAQCGTSGMACSACPGTPCDAGVCESCNATTCANGCCSGASCVTPDLNHCGVGALACHPCDGAKADSCTGGACKCGAADACGDGQRCSTTSGGSTCVCDATSCPMGCCDGNQCKTRGDTQCGVGGAACLNCIANNKTDTCSATGMCQCGTGDACSSGESCIGGHCGCNGQSCSGGCCSDTLCLISGPMSCGQGGDSCLPCDATTANRCSATGVCECNNTNSPCGPGQRCTGAGCVCDAESCPDGCCSGSTCIRSPNDVNNCGSFGNSCVKCPTPQTCSNGVCSGCTSLNCGTCCLGANCQPPSVDTCGSGGLACTACNPQRANNCDAGQCACGAGAACASGQVCDAGACTCDPSSCSGCCQGNVCIGADAGMGLSACGSAGVACQTCPTLRSTSCTLGTCRCGNNAECAQGLRCAGGACVCDATSGCNGCCTGNVCQAAGTTSTAACGLSGGVCQPCDSSKADNCAGGTCHCGPAAACGAGLICQGGTCVCNASSGCGGCCQNGTTCVAGMTTAICGTGGATCVNCSNVGGNGCTNNQCTCGVLAACGAGHACLITLCGG